MCGHMWLAIGMTHEIFGMHCHVVFMPNRPHAKLASPYVFKHLLRTLGYMLCPTPTPNFRQRPTQCPPQNSYLFCVLSHMHSYQIMPPIPFMYNMPNKYTIHQFIFKVRVLVYVYSLISISTHTKLHYALEQNRNGCPHIQLNVASTANR